MLLIWKKIKQSISNSFIIWFNILTLINNFILFGWSSCLCYFLYSLTNVSYFEWTDTFLFAVMNLEIDAIFYFNSIYSWTLKKPKINISFFPFLFDWNFSNFWFKSLILNCFFIQFHLQRLSKRKSLMLNL